MRLVKEVPERTLVDISEVLSAPDQDMLNRAIGKIEKVCLRAEDNMFRDYPRLSDKYRKIYRHHSGERQLHGENKVHIFHHSRFGPWSIHIRNHSEALYREKYHADAGRQSWRQDTAVRNGLHSLLQEQ